MSDYPMLISNKLHSFRNFVQQWRAFGVYVASFTDAWIETLPSKGIQ